MVTTATLVEELIQLLWEHGNTQIAIGEGAVLNEEIGLNTPKGYKRYGLARVAKGYGVRLLDFNEGPFETLELDGLEVQVAEPILQADFLINLPVLKTHIQAQVSLGLKNLKGYLRFPFKRKFHWACETCAFHCPFQGLKGGLLPPYLR